jgi:multiple sugar transport system ATP-binding protein
VAVVSLKQVSKVYADGTTGVSALDLDIADGEFMVLVGPSGCGKTTALRCIAGLEDISSGQLTIGDRVVNHVPSKDRNIAMVFQSYALYPHMTVYENMAFGLKLLKTPKEDVKRRVEEAARVLDLERFLDRKPKALSGGQRQRVALGRAIVREPAAFLMDEPLSNLDAALRVQTRAEILKLQKRLGTTTIYVTHDQVEAMTMGDRIAVMRSGHLQQVGAPELLYNHPVNIFVAGFIGSPAMNFATVEVDGDTVQLGSTRLKLTGRVGKAAASRPAGSKLLLGFRPEDLELGGSGNGRLAIPMTVDVIEYLGREELVHAQAEGVDVIALLDSDRKLSIGERVELTVAPEQVHLFDPETEENLAA